MAWDPSEAGVLGGMEETLWDWSRCPSDGPEVASPMGFSRASERGSELSGFQDVSVECRKSGPWGVEESGLTWFSDSEGLASGKLRQSAARGGGP